VSVTIEPTRQGSYLVVKDRWRAPFLRDGAGVDLEVGSVAQARRWAECEVLMRGALGPGAGAARRSLLRAT
jgi:hypothetical protein